jgi:hypothetical protein
MIRAAPGKCSAQARCSLDHLNTPGIQESAGPDEQGIGPIAPDILEGGIDLAAGAGVENLDL